MTTFLDGYNILFTLEISAPSLEDEREELLSQLEEQELTVVFDGPNFSRTHRGPLEIVFTAAGQTADDYIIDEVERLTPRTPCTVVTADRRLAQAVKQHGAHVKSPGKFLQKLHKSDPRS